MRAVLPLKDAALITSFSRSIEGIPKSISKSIALLKSSPRGVNQLIIGFNIPDLRRLIASSSKAVPNQSAPASSKALETGIKP